MKKKYKVIFEEHASVEFENLPGIIKTRILKKLRFWISTGTPLQFAKKLHDSESRFRFRVGDYRIIFTQKSTNIFIILLILKVAHRRDVYA